MISNQPVFALNGAYFAEMQQILILYPLVRPLDATMI